VLSLGGSTFLYGVLLASYSLMSFIFTPLLCTIQRPLWTTKNSTRSVWQCLASVTSCLVRHKRFGCCFLGRMLFGTTAATCQLHRLYVADVTTRNERLRYLGLLGAAAGLAFILGPAIGGTLSSLFGYSVPSFLGFGSGFYKLGFSVFLLPEPA